MRFGIGIYNYNNYRELLRDWFWAAKAEDKKISFRYISRKLGLSSPNHFHLVISGKRHLSDSTFDGILRLMQPSSRERQYLELLFERGRCDDSAAIEDLDRRLSLLRRQSLEDELSDDQYRIVGNALAWYIKMGAVAFEGKNVETVTEIILESCKVAVDATQIQAALDALVQMDLLAIEDGICRFDFGNITTKWDFDRYEIKTHHMNNLKLAMQAMPWPIDERFFSSVTVACDQETYDFAVQEIRMLCLKILERANTRVASAEDCDRVATLHFSLFPYFAFDPKRSEPTC